MPWGLSDCCVTILFYSSLASFSLLQSGNLVRFSGQGSKGAASHSSLISASTKSGYGNFLSSGPIEIPKRRIIVLMCFKGAPQKASFNFWKPQYHLIIWYLELSKKRISTIEDHHQHTGFILRCIIVRFVLWRGSKHCDTHTWRPCTSMPRSEGGKTQVPSKAKDLGF